jgi:hypothetical protein
VVLWAEFLAGSAALAGFGLPTLANAGFAFPELALYRISICSCARPTRAARAFVFERRAENIASSGRCYGPSRTTASRLRVVSGAVRVSCRQHSSRRALGRSSNTDEPLGRC